MSTLNHMQAHALGGSRSKGDSLLDAILPAKRTASAASPARPTDPHAVVAALTPAHAERLGIKGGRLSLVAGNIYECPATRDFWAVRNGKLVRLTGKESMVDDGETLTAMDSLDPETHLNKILADLEDEF